jgi:hypothetical protein
MSGLRYKTYAKSKTNSPLSVRGTRFVQGRQRQELLKLRLILKTSTLYSPYGLDAKLCLLEDVLTS